MVLWQPGLVFPHPVSKDQGFFFFFLSSLLCLASLGSMGGGQV